MITLKEHLSASVNEAKNVPTGKVFKNIDLEIDSDELSTLTSSSAKHVQLYIDGKVDMRGVDVPKTLQISPQNAKCQVDNLAMRGGTLIVDCDDNNGMIWFKNCNIDVDNIVVKEDEYQSNYVGPMFELSKVHTKVLKISNPEDTFFWTDVRNEARYGEDKYNINVLKQLDLGKKPIFDTLLLYWDDGMVDGLSFGDGIVVTNDKRFKFEDDEVPVKELKKLPGYYIGCFNIKKIPFDPGY